MLRGRAIGAGICVVALAGDLASCGRAPERAIDTQSHLVTVAPDLTGECRDVGGAVDGARACWSDSCAHGVCRVERTLPDFAAATPLGFRCDGVRDQRRCVDRSADAPRFACEGPRCRQVHPRVPDANEWTCADARGATLCRELAKAAGVVLGPAHPSFVCGERIVGGTRNGERLCLDLSPDFPDGRARNWSCHYEAEPRLTRVCIARPSAALGGTCSPPLGCPSGALCVKGSCLPRLPRPTCWLDTDCKSGHCRLGSCVGDL